MSGSLGEQRNSLIVKGLVLQSDNLVQWTWNPALSGSSSVLLPLPEVGNPKTPTPSSKTPATDQVPGLSHGLPLWIPSADHPKGRIKIINKVFTYCLSNRSLMWAKFWAMRCANVTDLGWGSYPLLCMKERDASKFVLLPLRHFYSAHSPAGS